jgi:hypothetical protein
VFSLSRRWPNKFHRAVTFDKRPADEQKLLNSKWKMRQKQAANGSIKPSRKFSSFMASDWIIEWAAIDGDFSFRAIFHRSLLFWSTTIQYKSIDVIVDERKSSTDESIGIFVAFFPSTCCDASASFHFSFWPCVHLPAE